MTKEPKKVNQFHFLAIRLIIVSILLASLFAILAVFINLKSKDTIEKVGELYMNGMTEQISLHYETTIRLRLNQLNALVETAPPDSVSHEQLLDNLEYNAKARDFACLALCDDNGAFEMIYGDTVQVNNPDVFLESLRNGEDRITTGTDENDEKVILLGVPCTYRMADGTQSIALVAGLPVDTMQQLLFLDSTSSLVYSYIIRKDGSYVIRGSNKSKNNYFDRLYSIFDEQGEAEARRCIQEMTDSMEAGEDYSAILDSDLGRRHLYCTSLPYCNWYLVVIMPFDSLTELVSRMSYQWSGMVYLVCSLALAAIIWIFSYYLKLAKRQMEALEQARLEAERANQAKSEFLSNMSHDIRTPMNAIVGMTTIATANIGNPEQVENCLRKITLSSKHLLGLINDVLDMSKIESGKMTLNMDQVSLREVMDNVVNIIQPQVRAKHQYFDVFIHNITAENVCCDSVRLNQVLINLLGNSVKFTPEEGSIHMHLYEEASPKGDAYVRTHLKVGDTGIGMSQEYLGKIFESFSREDNARVQKTEGTGLGMAITKYIVDAMGGTITVKSELGKGSEFHVTLDLLRATIQEIDMVLPDWNMLVVDDDQQLCESVIASLQSIGVHPDWCMDAPKALQMIEERHSRQDDYHIILIDWKLPNMNGIDAAREIRRLYGDEIPILLISAYDWSEIEDEAKAAGVTGFIGKPLFKSTLFYGLKPFADTADGTSSESQRESIPNPVSVSLCGRHILLAEDNDLNWEIAQELLSEIGLELDWAQNGQICLEKFQNSTVGYYDAILMDLRMPVMNGYQATEAIRALTRPDAQLPIIAMTADAFSEDIQKCLHCGMDAHVAKPIDIREVTHQLEKFIK